MCQSPERCYSIDGGGVVECRTGLVAGKRIGRILPRIIAGKRASLLELAAAIALVLTLACCVTSRVGADVPDRGLQYSAITDAASASTGLHAFARTLDIPIAHSMPTVIAMGCGLADWAPASTSSAVRSAESA